MCTETKICFFISLFALLLFSAWGVLHGQEQEQWYLIKESELQSIEAYKRSSEAEKQSWLLQAQQLSAKARSLAEESASLSAQLRFQREANQKLAQSFNEYEDGQLRLLLQKDTQILKLETGNKGKDTVITRLGIALGIMVLGIVGYSAVKIFG
jgi:hypothetical protein